MKKSALIFLTCLTVNGFGLDYSVYADFPYLCKEEREQVIEKVESMKNQLLNQEYETNIAQGMNDAEAAKKAQYSIKALIRGLKVQHKVICWNGEDKRLDAILDQQKEDARRDRGYN